MGGMKRIGCIFCVAAVIACVFLSACGREVPLNEAADYMQQAAQAYAPWDADNAQYSAVSDMKIVAAVGELELHIDPETTDFAIYNNKTGQIVHSNPMRANSDISIDEDILGEWISSLSIRVYDDGMNESLYTSYDDAVAYDQFALYTLEDGVRIVYKLGQDASSKLLPPVLSVETFESISSQGSSRQQRILKGCYQFLETAEMANGIPSDHMDKEAYLSRYPILKTTDVYVLREVSEYQEKQLMAYLQEVGFTKEQILAENTWAGYTETNESVCFVIPLDLVIKDGGLKASIDSDLIGIPAGYTLNHVSMLCGFNGGVKTGEFLLPDGSGALMPMAGKNGATYSQTVYGVDKALAQGSEGQWSQTVVLPVFGSMDDSGSMLAAIISGEAEADITARQCGGSNPLAVAYPTFEYTVVDDKNKGTEKNTLALMPASDHTSGLFEVQYFCWPDKQSYAQLAVYYRDYLEKKGVLEADTDIRRTLMLDFYGAIKTTTVKFGMSVSSLVGMTTFDDAQVILQEFEEKGVDALSVRYLGINQGGMQNQVASSMRIPGCLGGYNQWKKLQEFTRSEEIQLFPDFLLTTVQTDGLWDGFSASADASKRVDYKTATVGRLNVSSGNIVNTGKRYILSPVSVVENAKKLLKDLTKKEQKEVALSSLGYDLNSDFGMSSSFASRVEAQQEMASILEAFADSGCSLVIETGNLYAGAYADIIVNLPSSCSGFRIECESIPFAQIVYSGSSLYTGEAFNSSGDLWKKELKAIETGSLVYFGLMGENNLALKGSEYEDLISLDYTLWLEQAVESWKRVEMALTAVDGARISDHRSMGSQLFKTTYDNGAYVLVNYSDEEQVVEGLTVPARGYAIGGVNG